MAEGRFEPYHVPQQSRRDKLRVVASSSSHSHNQLQLQGCSAATGNLVPILDPALISSSGLITCSGAAAGLHNPAPAGDAKDQGSNFMGYNMGGGGGILIGASSSSSSATNHLYVDPQSSVQLNPSPIQDISSCSPFFYNPQSLRFLEQSFHGGGGGEVMVYRPEPLSVGHHHHHHDGPNGNDHITNSNSNNNSNKYGQGLSLSLSSPHHSQQTSLPLELNLQRYDSSMYSAKVVGAGAGGGCVFPGGGDGSTSNELLSRSSVPLGPFTGYASILKGSRFLKPAQQLLEELCDVGRGVYTEKMVAFDSILLDPSLECFSGTDESPRSCRNGGENENRKKKSRLISMLNEVYKRYKQYYQQMQAVISSFESVAGVRNAAPFASLALKAMSKHFRCLKGAITEQLQLMIESRGHMSNDKDSAPGFDNSGSGVHYGRPPPQNSTGYMEHQPVWRPQRGLPERAVTVLRSWLFEHFLHPYPTDTDKLMLAKQTGLSRNQVSNWFINARVRLWKPMVEEIHMLETRQVEKGGGGSQRDGQTGDHGQNDQPIPPPRAPITSENSSTPTTKRYRELGLKRTHNDLSMIPAGGNNESVGNLSFQNSSSYVTSGGGFGVSKASGSGGGVSLTLGLYQNNNNNLGLPDHYPINAARRFGLDGNGDGGYAAGGILPPNRQFEREIVGGQLLHDFVG